MSGTPLSEREQQYLEHLRRAEELEVSLAEYGRSFQVDAKELYNARRTLIRKGVLAARANGEESEAAPAQASDFVPVQVVARGRPPSTAVCRIQHPSGLLIECASFPPASWLAVLLSGAGDVPA